MRFRLLIHIVAFLLASTAFAHVRTLTSKTDGILTVKAALGIATIIQIPEAIQSAIIGDQSGFKVEYLDRAVTIKPLRSGAKTNMYLVTEHRRYNIRLVTVAQDLADYIVYVKNPGLDKVPTKWSLVNKVVESDELKLAIARIGQSEGGFILIDAKLSTSTSNGESIKPEDIWVKQGVASKVINGLFLSDVRLSKSNPITIGISLSKSDLVSNRPITVEVRVWKTLSLTLTEGLMWK